MSRGGGLPSGRGLTPIRGLGNSAILNLRNQIHKQRVLWNAKSFGKILEKYYVRYSNEIEAGFDPYGPGFQNLDEQSRRLRRGEIMLFFDRRMSQERRTDKERRAGGDPEYNGAERRTGDDPRSGKDRRTPKDRRSSAYYRLSARKREEIDRIIALLEKDSEKEYGGQRRG